MLIEQSKETYYEALQDCSIGWHENKNSYMPFIKYYLGLLIKASNEFESRVDYLSSEKISKPERIKRLIQNTVGKINKKQILEKCPDISTKTVERTLSDLLKQGLIKKIGASSATSYVWVEKDKLYTKLAEGLKDIQEGRSQSFDSAMKDIRQDLGI